jgi:hypothetical protein
MTEPRKYRYKVSLRITHPTMPAEKFTEELGLEPYRTWTVGQPRQTPKGSPLPGIYKNSYWSHSFETPQDGNLEAFLLSVINNLAIHAATFRGVAEAGGHAEFFIGYFMEASNVGLYFDPELQQKCAALGISLSLDIYDPDGPTSGAAQQGVQPEVPASGRSSG